ncbi:MAG: cupin-like domain-containing protein [Planctomycetaceae bacterium]
MLETEVTKFRHRLAETGLFEDDALLPIIESHPRDFCNVSVMGADNNHFEWGEADTSGLSAGDLLAAVNRGRMWLNIRRIERFQPDLWKLVERLYGELEQTCPEFVTGKRSGNLLISSPKALVYYHLDVPQNILWHIRGRKRVWVYSPEPRFVNPDVLESTVAGERVEDLPYEPSFDDGAAVFDLRPGDVVTWPQNSPHRVENREGMNVSLSTEHYTASQLRYVRVCRANRLLRKTLRLPCRSHRTEGLGYALKSSVFFGCRLMQRLVGGGDVSYDYPMPFRVDLDAPDCISRI